MRAQGWYWVRYRGELGVAFWGKNYFWLGCLGHDFYGSPIGESKLEVISGPLEEPKKEGVRGAACE